MRLTEVLAPESPSLSPDPAAADSLLIDTASADSAPAGPTSIPDSGGRRKTDHYAIPCKYCMPVLRDKPLKGIILGIHGFSGSKESTGLHVLAKKVVPEGYGIVCFDLPAHWKSPAAPEMLTVENAMRDILFMAEECRREFPDLPKYIFATSFGAYLTLLCCKESSCLIAGGDKGDKSLTAAGGESSDCCRRSACGLSHYPPRPCCNHAGSFLNLLNMTAEEFRAKAPDCTNDPADRFLSTTVFTRALWSKRL